MKKSISGIRGIFGKDFTLKDVLKFCNNFSPLVESKCVIATDTRPSASMIKEAASSALMQTGIDVYDLGVAPTPVVFREARKYGAGVVVTSSHNPIEWNGLKFIVNGRGINEQELQTVLTDQNTSKTKVGKEQKIESNYVNEVVEFVGKIDSAPKIVVDIGGGAAKTVAPTFLKNLGCDVQVINEELEKSTRGPDPTTDNLDDLITNTSSRDLGFAFDLDADRLVVVKDGKKQSPDVTLGLGIAKTLEKGYKKFVLSIDTSVSIEKYIKENGGQVQRSKVGEANVIELMLKTESQAGGEGSSAGFILPEFNYCREGILTSGLISSMFGTSSFNEVLSFMENYKQIRDKVSVESSLHDKTLEVLSEKIKEKSSDLVTIDGVKAIFDEDSWVLIRRSNTEDIIRVSSESSDAQKAQTILQDTKELVKKCYEQVR